jgi:RhtB (resistance to homoserine/threonine) family protein
MIEVLIFALINLLGSMSPGPDFAIVTRFSLTGSRRSAYLASLGIASALIIHVFYCLLGVAVFIKSTPVLFRTIQVIGALYLAYLGIRLIFEKKKPTSEQPPSQDRNAFFSGFLTNILNPKATLFLLSLFTQFITPETSVWQKIAFGISVPLVALLWFLLLSYLLTHSLIYPRLQKYQKGFGIVMGCILILLSLYVLLGFSL